MDTEKVAALKRVRDLLGELDDFARKVENGDATPAEIVAARHTEDQLAAALKKADDVRAISGEYKLQAVASVRSIVEGSTNAVTILKSLKDKNEEQIRYYS